MDKKKNYTALKKFCKGLGLDLFGVADITGVKKDFVLSAEVLDSVEAAVVLGMRLSQAVLTDILKAPTRLYFNHYRTVNMFLDQAALRVSAFIQGKGFRALPIPASVIVDWEKQSAHLSHKKLGALAGIGWIGRNNLLVTKDFGSQIRLVSILTDMPLTIDKPLKTDCGACRRCVNACPAGAIKEDQQAFDARRCFEKLKEFQKQHLVDQYICGVCVNFCPGQKAAQERRRH